MAHRDNPIVGSAPTQNNLDRGGDQLIDLINSIINQGLELADLGLAVHEFAGVIANDAAELRNMVQTLHPDARGLVSRTSTEAEYHQVIEIEEVYQDDGVWWYRDASPACVCGACFDERGKKQTDEPCCPALNAEGDWF